MMSIRLKNGATALQDTHVVTLGGHETPLYSYYINNDRIDLLDDQSLRFVSRII